jgi:NADH-quinone oxidoreductase subunit H
MDTIITLIKFLIVIVPILLVVATLTLLERKVMAAIQIRRGPNVIGFGTLQPLADGLKLLIKEFVLPLKANKFLFIMAPILFLTISFTIWSIIPFETHAVASPNLGVLCFLAFSSLSVYGILLGGWASNSRYAFLGALRSASQMLSYELVLSLLVLLVCLLAQSLNFTDIVVSQNIYFVVTLLPFTLMYIIAILAETNRTPFDLPEAEAELVAGYSVEYSSGPFAFYFIAEYCNIIIWSLITIIFFFAAWFLLVLSGFISFAIKSILVMILFCWIRAALPRYRWDQLMWLAWRAFLPIILIAILFMYSGSELAFSLILVYGRSFVK